MYFSPDNHHHLGRKGSFEHFLGKTCLPMPALPVMMMVMILRRKLQKDSHCLQEGGKNEQQQQPPEL